MKKYIFGILGIGAIIFLIFAFSFNIIKAERIEKLNRDPVTGRFELGPTRISTEANQGQELQYEVTLANHTGEKMGFFFEFEDFTASNDPNIGAEFVNEVAPELSAKNWFKPEANEFTLEHGEKMHVTVKINVPDDAILGEHQAGIFIKNKKLKEIETKEGGTLKVSSRLGLPVLINVNGTKEGKKVQIKQEAGFKEFKSDKKLYDSGPIKFGLNIENTGNVHVKPFGYITVKRFGQKVDKININEWIVYRNSSRIQEVTWSKGFLIGSYQAEAVVFIDVNGVRTEFKKTVDFWVIPWKFILLVVTAIILLILIWILALRRYMKKFEKNILDRLKGFRRKTMDITGGGNLDLRSRKQDEAESEKKKK